MHSLLSTELAVYKQLSQQKQKQTLDYFALWKLALPSDQTQFSAKFFLKAVTRKL